MHEPDTAVVADVTELSILWPHLADALERDQGAADSERVSTSAGYSLPVNADVLSALASLHRDIPRLARWAARVVAEPPVTRTVYAHLQHIPRWHERMLVTAAEDEATQLADQLHACLVEVKTALGLRTPDRRLGQWCPLHDAPLCELVAPGDEGRLQYTRVDETGMAVQPRITWMRRDVALCRTCHATWIPAEYLALGRLMRQADTRRLSTTQVEGAA